MRNWLQVVAIIRINFKKDYESSSMLTELIIMLIFAAMQYVLRQYYSANILVTIDSAILLAIILIRNNIFLFLSEKNDGHFHIEKANGLTYPQYYIGWFTHFLLNAAYKLLLYLFMCFIYDLVNHQLNLQSLALTYAILMLGVISLYSLYLMISSFCDRSETSLHVITLLFFISGTILNNLTSITFLAKAEEIFMPISTLPQVLLLILKPSSDTNSQTFSTSKYALIYLINFIGYYIIFILVETIKYYYQKKTKIRQKIQILFHKPSNLTELKSKPLLKEQENSQRSENTKHLNMCESKDTEKLCLDVKNIQKAFKKELILDKVSFRAFYNQITCIIGKNGAGKSTLFNIIAGIQHYELGEIFFFQNNAPTKKLKIGYCCQKNVGCKKLKVKDFIEFFWCLKSSIKPTKQQLEELMSQFTLVDSKDKYLYELSGGNQRRVFLACAFSANPNLIILDQPTSGLDSIAKNHFYKFIHRTKNQNTAILIITTQLNEFLTIADKVYVLKQMKIITQQNFDFKFEKQILRIVFDISKKANQCLKIFFRQVLEEQSSSVYEQLSKDIGCLRLTLNESKQNKIFVEKVIRKMMDLQISIYKCEKKSNLEAIFNQTFQTSKDKEYLAFTNLKSLIYAPPIQKSFVWKLKSFFYFKFHKNFNYYSSYTLYILIPLILFAYLTLQSLSPQICSQLFLDISCDSLENSQINNCLNKQFQAFILTGFNIISAEVIFIYLFNGFVITDIVKDSEIKNKLVQMSMGLNIYIYWIVNAIFDGLVILISLSFGWSIMMILLPRCLLEVFVSMFYALFLGSIMFILTFLSFSYLISLFCEYSRTVFCTFPICLFSLHYVTKTIVEQVYLQTIVNKVNLQESKQHSVILSFGLLFSSISLLACNFTETTIGSLQYSIYLSNQYIRDFNFIFKSTYAYWPFLTALLLQFTICFAIVLIVDHCKFKFINSSKNMDLTNFQQVQSEDLIAEKFKIMDLQQKQLIVIESLYSKYKHNFTIKDLNLIIKKGQIFGLLGPNGSGKSTTFNLMISQISKQFGSIKYDGQEVRDHIKVFEKISLCPQFYYCHEDLTVFQTLNYFCELKGLAPDIEKNYIHSLLVYFGLEKKLSKRIRHLSSGEQRLICSIITFLGFPQIMLFDEPSFGIDPANSQKIYQLIQFISKTHQNGTMVVTHRTEEAFLYCDRVGILIKGELVCIDQPFNIIKRLGRGFIITIKYNIYQDFKYILQKIHSKFPISEYINNTESQTLTMNIPYEAFKFEIVFDFIYSFYCDGQVYEFSIRQEGLDQIIQYLANQHQTYDYDKNNRELEEMPASFQYESKLLESIKSKIVI